MPIKPEDRHRYPDNWDAVRRAILRRACNFCEFCGVRNHTMVRRSGRHKPVYIVLTIAHLDHTPENNDPDNLRALCQLCHNQYDAKHRAATRAETLKAKKGQKELFKGDNDGNL